MYSLTTSSTIKLSVKANLALSVSNPRHASMTKSGVRGSHTRQNFQVKQIVSINLSASSTKEIDSSNKATQFHSGFQTRLTLKKHRLSSCKRSLIRWNKRQVSLIYCRWCWIKQTYTLSSWRKRTHSCKIDYWTQTNRYLIQKSPKMVFKHG